MFAIWRKSGPYVWILLGAAVLSAIGLVWYSYGMMKAKSELAAAAADNGNEFRFIRSNEPFHAKEDYELRNPHKSAYSFPDLIVTKAKQSKGLQATAKGAHIVEQFAAAAGGKVGYVAERSYKQDNDEWTEYSLIIVDPHTQTIAHEPVSYIHGSWREAAEKSVRIIGFTKEGDAVFTGIWNEGANSTVYVGQYKVQDDSVFAVMEIGRLGEADGGSRFGYSALSDDGSKLLLQDKRQGIVAYDLKAGTRRVVVPLSPPSDAQPQSHAKEAFLPVPQAGSVYYSEDANMPGGWLIPLNGGEAVRLFAGEPGFIQLGLAAPAKMMYYNFTYDRSQQQRISGDKRDVLLAQGVRLTDYSGKLLRSFSLPADSQERIEYGGAFDDNKILLHRYTVATNGKGQRYKKTSGWMLGDVASGALTPLNKIDVPDNWDRKDIGFAQSTVDAYADGGTVQAFVNVADGTFYMTRWKTDLVYIHQDQDAVMFADEPSKRVLVSSLTRPDLLVAALNYKKYNWDNRDFGWLEGHWLVRYNKQPEGDKMYMFQLVN